METLQIIKLDFSKPDSLKAAIGPARKVVCALGASEDQVNLSAPKQVCSSQFQRFSPSIDGNAL
jgi:hypothetical protein